MIPRDKLLHIGMGIGAVVVALLAIWLARYSVGAACAVATTVFGAFYEFQQWYRREGAVEVWDAVATAAPGWVAWAVFELI